jgi:hypothetical protein
MKVLKIIMVILISCLFGLTLNVLAAQFDAPYYDLQEKNKDKWAVEDKQINAKLAALEKKFGKKPNIYWATYTQQLQGSKVHHNDKHVDKAGQCPGFRDGRPQRAHEADA